LRPHESPAFQALGEQAQCVAVPPENFDQIATLPAEHKYVTRKRVVFQHRLSERRAYKPFSLEVDSSMSGRRVTRTPAAIEQRGPPESIWCDNGPGILNYDCPKKARPSWARNAVRQTGAIERMPTRQVL
jgi:hypothetical protein